MKKISVIATFIALLFTQSVNSGPQLVIYTSESCSECYVVKRMLDRLNVPYRDCDIFRSTQCSQEWMSYPQEGPDYMRGTPVIAIGRDYVVGNEPVEIRSLLKRHGMIK